MRINFPNFYNFAILHNKIYNIFCRFFSGAKCSGTQKSSSRYEQQQTRQFL